jgi:hypothetical protein
LGEGEPPAAPHRTDRDRSSSSPWRRAHPVDGLFALPSRAARHVRSTYLDSGTDFGHGSRTEPTGAAAGRTNRPVPWKRRGRFWRRGHGRKVLARPACVRLRVRQAATREGREGIAVADHGWMPVSESDRPHDGMNHLGLWDLGGGGRRASRRR